MRSNPWPGMRRELEAELFGNIMPFWTSVAVEGSELGFHGRIGADNGVDSAAGKGLVMHARLLWAFSAVRRVRDEPEYAAASLRAMDFLDRFLADPVNGGYWWRTDAKGEPEDRRKVVYGQAFALYAMAESLRLEEDEEVREKADALFSLLERHARDTRSGGYREILDEAWNVLPDGRLSEVDVPCDKSMNTNLHVIEAYTNYYRVNRIPEVREALMGVVGWFVGFICDGSRGHLKLFLGEGGESLESIDSYGHDIEAAWLLHEAAEELGGDWPERLEPTVLDLAEAAVRDGIGASDGAMDYETHGGERITERIWWVQAEAMVGSRCLFDITGEGKWARLCLGFWEYIRKNLVDPEGGEWFWGAGRDGRPLPGREKGGMWKTPYHNSRACLEMMERIDAANRCRRTEGRR